LECYVVRSIGQIARNREDEVIITIARAMTLVGAGATIRGGLPGIAVPPHLGWRMPGEGKTV